MKTRFILTVAAILVAMMFAINGCGSSSNIGNDNNDSDSNVTELSGSFYGTMISDVMGGLEEGAIRELGGDAMGLILQYLGWGNSGNSEEATLLESMNIKLDHIEIQLENILKDLTEIIGLINLSMDTILDAIIDPTTAMGDIYTADQSLQLMSIGDDNTTLKPGEGNKTKITTFANEHEEKIRGSVNTIYHSFKPMTIGTPPALNTLINKANIEIQLGLATVADAYTSLEIWTSQLITSQLQGVNIVMESRRILDGNASALYYFQNDYKPQLEDEIGNPEKGVSFIYNAWSLALLNASLYPSDGKSFFSQDIKDFLQRAQFYKLRTLNEDNYGLHVLIFTTQDIDSPKTLLAIKKGGEGFMYLDCKDLDASILGKAYDYWVDTDHVRSSNLYSVSDCQPQSPVDVGTYQIGFDGVNFIAEATVEKYDENYTVQTDGNFTYGLTSTLYRPQINHYGESSTNWVLRKNVSRYSTLTGSANDWPVKLVIDDITHVNVKIASDAELQGYFTFDPLEDLNKNITVHYKVKYYLKVDATDCESCGSGDMAEAGYRTGIHNVTENKSECSFHRIISVGREDYLKDHYYLDHTCSFTAKPGNEYYTYFKMYVAADHYDDAAPFAESEVDGVNFIHIRFDE